MGPAPPKAGTYLGEARDAPCLLTAEIPDAAAIAADPAHWNIATSALVRALIFDGLTIDHPAVSMLLGVLAPIAEAELAYYGVADASLHGAGTDWDEAEPEFPELDGPVFLLGGRALVDAVWAAVGEDRLSEVLGVLVPVLDGAVPGLDDRVAADALIGAFATHYRCEQPGDAEVLQRIGRPGGNALENLAAGAVPPRDVLPVGLTMLSALARLCQSDSVSLLQRPPRNSRRCQSSRSASSARACPGTFPRRRRPALLQRAHRIADVCEAHGVTLPQVAMAFPLRHPVVAGIVVGMRSAGEARRNIESPGVDEADGRACGLGRHQGQVYRRGAVGEQALTRAEHQREHQEPVLIDQVVGHQRADDAGAAGDHDVVGPLALPHRGHQVALKHGRVVPFGGLP